MTPAAEKVVPRSSPAGAARSAPPPRPPEWPLENFVKTIGKIPAAAGRGLDRLAKVPVLGAVVRFFSSVWVGISILVLIGAYIAIGSGFSDFRAHFEMTDLQFFDAMPMRILLVCLVLDLSIVTLRRIPLTLFKLGPWTVHIGIITLITGSVWYFSQKEEGSVRVYLNQSVSQWYDTTERALFAYPVNPDGSFDTAHPKITPIRNLPIYNQYRPEDGNALNISLANALPGSDAALRIYSYYPCAVLQPAGARAGQPGEKGVGPAIAIKLTTMTDAFNEHWLIADSPAMRLLEFNFPFGFEYLRHPDPQRVKDLQAPFDGPYGLTVRVPKLNFERTYAIKPDEAIAVEGTPYTITPRDLQTMPMLSKGYEGASSTAMTVDVVRKDGDKTFDFQRMCVSRFPELSPDFVMQDGKMVRKQAGVDPDIQIIFHDISRVQNWITEAADGSLTLITRTPEGACTSQPLADKDVSIKVPDMPGGALQVRVSDRTDNAVILMKPDIVPPEQRPARPADHGDSAAFDDQPRGHRRHLEAGRHSCPLFALRADRRAAGRRPAGDCEPAQRQESWPAAGDYAAPASFHADADTV